MEFLLPDAHGHWQSFTFIIRHWPCDQSGRNEDSLVNRESQYQRERVGTEESGVRQSGFPLVDTGSACMHDYGMPSHVETAGAHVNG